jgi:hypothetical protein
VNTSVNFQVAYRVESFLIARRLFSQEGLCYVQSVIRHEVHVRSV